MKTYKCALISDIHVGFSKNTYKILEKFFATLAKENIDVLFVAGDVSANEFAQF
jgi:Icc-related predicted phosphoesterase